MQKQEALPIRASIAEGLTPESSPVRARFVVSVVSFKFDSSSAAVSAVLCVKS